MALLGFISVACSGDAEELDNTEEPKVEPKDTTNITDSIYTDTIWMRPVYFYDELVGGAELPEWMIHDADSLARKYPDGLDVYRGLYKHDTIYIAMTAASWVPPVFDKKGNPISWKNIDLWSYCGWKHIYSWRPDVWSDSLETAISAPDIFRRTIYIPDELVDTTTLPKWTEYKVNYFTKEHQGGLDIYRGEYGNDTIYMTMTVFYDHPYFYDKKGVYLNAGDIYEKSINWKRIFLWRPDDWRDFEENEIFVLRFFQVGQKKYSPRGLTSRIIIYKL